MAEEPLRRVVGDLDVSEVTAEVLNFMLETECVLHRAPRIVTPEEAQKLVDEIRIVEE